MWNDFFASRRKPFVLMKKLFISLHLLVIVSVLILTMGCKPNGDKNSTDVENPLQEKTFDSTRYPGGVDDNKFIDSTLQKDSLHR